MDGAEYLQSFKPSAETTVCRPLNFREDVLHDTTTEFESLLAAMYNDGHISALGSEEAAPLLEMAVYFREQEAFTRQYMSRIRKSPQRRIESRKASTKNLKKNYMHLDADERMRSDRELLLAIMLDSSRSLTANCVTMTHSEYLKSRDTSLGPRDVAALAIKTTVQNSRGTTASFLQRVCTPIEVERVMVGRKTIAVDMNLRYEGQIDQHLRGDFKTRQWDSPKWQLTSAMQELDGYCTLLEWTISRRLPYLPVFTPVAMESGTQESCHKSRRSDILLLNFAQPDIVPIQFKTGISDKDRQSYDTDNVAIITGEDMGLGVYGQGIRTDVHGKALTATTLRETFGHVATQWAAAYAGGKNGKRVAALNEQMRPAFERFDQILPAYMS